VTSLLRLNHMSVFRKGKALYSEDFHPGVNVIHGSNGSGKSTLMDFIFFGLGGDLRDWKPHAEHAEYVVLEVLAGTTTLTLRRDVSREANRSMQIFFGPIADALAAGPAQWKLSPYKRQNDNYSFSQVLFRAIGIPESISDGTSNITMHQVMRLIYGDQMTPIQRIFRPENFDTWQTRQAVGQLMCGIGGYALYEKQIQLRGISQEFDELSRQLRNLLAIASGYGDQILAEHIEPALAKSVRERNGLQAELINVLATLEEDAEGDDDVKRLQRTQARDVTRARRAVAELEDRIATLEYEIEDARQFILHLEQTLDEFEDAATTFFSLGAVHFEFCPACFTSIDGAPKEGHCHLCGAQASASAGDPKALAVRLDIEMQLTESRSLQADRDASLVTLKARLRTAQVQLRAASDAFELARRGHATEREKIVSDLSRKVGYLDSEIKVLENRFSLSKQLEAISAAKDALNARMGKLKSEIEVIEAVQRQRKLIAYTAVSDNAKRILDQDLKEHSDFGEVQRVSFDFADDWMAINNDKNRSRSASGMVVLKNSFLLSLYISAIKDLLFNLPRFLMIDNMEDKGMVQPRVWNFQETLLRECQAAAGEQQIIFTTSTLSPALEKPEYVVGRLYTRDHPSLDFGDDPPKVIEEI
jgi:uncharacterized small protein (DUF1192 family)